MFFAEMSDIDLTREASRLYACYSTIYQYDRVVEYSRPTSSLNPSIFVSGGQENTTVDLSRVRKVPRLPSVVVLVEVRSEEEVTTSEAEVDVREEAFLNDRACLPDLVALVTDLVASEVEEVLGEAQLAAEEVSIGGRAFKSIIYYFYWSSVQTVCDI